MVSKHRDTYTAGIKAVEAEKHGRDVARARYGTPEYEHGAPRPPDLSKTQSAGDASAAGVPEKGYPRDAPNNWVRGKGESAEGMPNFDHLRGRAKR